jgi:hypothetical protein
MPAWHRSPSFSCSFSHQDCQAEDAPPNLGSQARSILCPSTLPFTCHHQRGFRSWSVDGVFASQPLLSLSHPSFSSSLWSESQDPHMVHFGIKKKIPGQRVPASRKAVPAVWEWG